MCHVCNPKDGSKAKSDFRCGHYCWNALGKVGECTSECLSVALAPEKFDPPVLSFTETPTLLTVTLAIGLFELKDIAPNHSAKTNILTIEGKQTETVAEQEVTRRMFSKEIQLPPNAIFAKSKCSFESHAFGPNTLVLTVPKKASLEQVSIPINFGP